MSDGESEDSALPEHDDAVEGETVEQPSIPGLQQLLAVGEAWSGPLPHPEALAGYARLLPDAPERILAMAEKDISSRIDRADRLTNASIKTASRGQLAAISLTFVAIVAAIVFFAVGNVVAGGILVSLPVVMLVRALLGQVSGNQGDDGAGDATA